ncbi:MAG: DUF1127 domain-containing protein [Alphaproteobacteria bacterium]
MADVTLNSLAGARAGKSLFSQFRTFLQKRADYQRTLGELQSLDQRTLADLGIAPADFRAIARRETFGR